MTLAQRPPSVQETASDFGVPPSMALPLQSPISLDAVQDNKK